MLSRENPAAVEEAAPARGLEEAVLAVGHGALQNNAAEDRKTNLEQIVSFDAQGQDETPFFSAPLAMPYYYGHFPNLEQKREGLHHQF